MPTAVPLPCVAAYVASLGGLDAPTLAGHWYVFEGATNGGRFIARRLVEVLDLAPTALVALDPHGPAQRERWTSFRAGLDAFAAEIDALVAGAHRAFAFHRELFNARVAVRMGRVA